MKSRLGLVRSILLLLAIPALAACLPVRTTPSPPDPTPEFPPTDATSEFPSTDPAVARDEVVKYVRAQYPEVADRLGQPVWEALPEPAVHSLAVYGYTSDDWYIDTVVLPGGLVAVDGVLLEEDTFDVELKYRSPPPYIAWSGRYAPDTGITEDYFVNRSHKVEAIPPEMARDLAFGFLVQEHPEVDTPEQAWSETTADEDAWSSGHRYEAGNWEVVVWWYETHGMFEINAYYEDIGGQYVKIEWTGLVSADGEQIQERSFDSFFG
jgi:hypothetical protein